MCWSQNCWIAGHETGLAVPPRPTDHFQSRSPSQAGAVRSDLPSVHVTTCLLAWFRLVVFGCHVVEKSCTLIDTWSDSAADGKKGLLMMPLQANMPMNYGSCKRCELVVPGIISVRLRGESGLGTLSYVNLNAYKDRIGPWPQTYPVPMCRVKGVGVRVTGLRQSVLVYFTCGASFWSG